MPGTSGHSSEDLQRHRDALEAAQKLLAERRDEALDSVRRIARTIVRIGDDSRHEKLSLSARRLLEAPDKLVEANLDALLFELSNQIGAASALSGSVLIVEDDPIPGKLLQATLVKAGWQAEVAETAKEAEAVLASKPIVAIVLDLVLPDADGRNLLLRLKEDPATRTVPVYVASARSDPHVRAECLALGAEEFLAKPVDAENLLELVTGRSVSTAADATVARASIQVADRAALAKAFQEAGWRSQTLALVGAVGPDRGAKTATGEEALQQVAETIADSVGDAALVARSGLDVLAVLFGESDLETVRQKLQTAREKLAGDTENRLDFSAGITLVDAGTDLEQAIDEAGHLLYLAQSSTEGQLVCDPEQVRPPTMRILLAEDDEIAAKLLLFRLTREPGFEVVHCTNGDDALAEAGAEKFDLAILDVNMPGLSGFDVLARLREMPDYKDMPIAMLTALGSERDVVRGLELGADDYIVKPFSPTELIARVRRLLGRSTTS